MTEPTPRYKTQQVIDYELTEVERRIVAWYRKNTGGLSNWMGTIQYYEQTNIVQLTDHVKAGQVKR